MSSTSSILFVDDQKSARELFQRLLDPAKYRVVLAESVADAEAAFAREPPDVVITDLRMPDVDGLAGLERFHRIDPEVPVVVITAFGTVETAVEAMKRGAFDYLRKPFDPSEIEILIDRALAHRNLVRENAQLRSEVARRRGDPRIIHRSPVMASVIDLVARVAPSDFPVLILGESGTGKDLIARRIHQLSHRQNGPFVSLNCSAIPEHLLESELFGHEKGAFSGATAARAGFFAEASGGTIFLDEIGDMSLDLQPKLLRVLENGEFYPVGGRSLRRADARLVTASNRDIQELVRQAKFREDLYYRVNTVRVVLPPLRARPEDIPPLIEHFLVRIREASPRAPRAVSAAAMRCLLEYRWPGNVRELEHTIERASLVADTDEIRPEDLPQEVRTQEPAAPAPDGERYKEARAAFERAYFTTLLDRTGGKVQAAADIAGLHRSSLYEKLAKLGLHVDREG